MDIVILCAGKGNRLEHYTKDKPKCMVEIFGIPLITWLINNTKIIKPDNIYIVDNSTVS